MTQLADHTGRYSGRARHVEAHQARVLTKVSIAEKIIEQQEGPFDPSQFVDRYEEALKALIEDKKKGHEPAKVAEPDDTNVVDLMSALRASLSAKGKGAAKSAAKEAKAPTKTKAKARKAG